MNANIILDGFNAILNQLIAAAVAEAVKPLEERITVLQAAYTDWTAMEHVAAKAVQPMQDRIVALEINQTLVSSAKINIADLVAELVGATYIKRNEVVDLVDKVVGNAIEAYDFNDIIDWDNKVEEGINNYDFSDIVGENMPDMVDEDRVQDMINESLDNLSISRN
jgi:ribosomal protein L7/L12